MLEPMPPFGQFDGTQVGVDHALVMRRSDAATLAYRGATWAEYARIPLYVVYTAGATLIAEVVERFASTPAIQQDPSLDRLEYITAGVMLLGTVVCGALRERSHRLLRQAEALEPSIVTRLFS